MALSPSTDTAIEFKLGVDPQQLTAIVATYPGLVLLAIQRLILSTDPITWKVQLQQNPDIIQALAYLANTIPNFPSLPTHWSTQAVEAFFGQANTALLASPGEAIPQGVSLNNLKLQELVEELEHRSPTTATPRLTYQQLVQQYVDALAAKGLQPPSEETVRAIADAVEKNITDSIATDLSLSDSQADLAIAKAVSTVIPPLTVTDPLPEVSPSTSPPPVTQPTPIQPPSTPLPKSPALTKDQTATVAVLAREAQTLVAQEVATKVIGQATAQAVTRTTHTTLTDEVKVALEEAVVQALTTQAPSPTPQNPTKNVQSAIVRVLTQPPPSTPQNTIQAINASRQRANLPPLTVPQQAAVTEAVQSAIGKPIPSRVATRLQTKLRATRTLPAETAAISAIVTRHTQPSVPPLSHSAARRVAHSVVQTTSPAISQTTSQTNLATTERKLAATKLALIYSNLTERQLTRLVVLQNTTSNRTLARLLTRYSNLNPLDAQAGAQTLLSLTQEYWRTHPGLLDVPDPDQLARYASKNFGVNIKAYTSGVPPLELRRTLARTVHTIVVQAFSQNLTAAAEQTVSNLSTADRLTLQAELARTADKLILKLQPDDSVADLLAEAIQTLPADLEPSLKVALSPASEPLSLELHQAIGQLEQTNPSAAFLHKSLSAEHLFTTELQSAYPTAAAADLSAYGQTLTQAFFPDHASYFEFAAYTLTPESLGLDPTTVKQLPRESQEAFLRARLAILHLRDPAKLAHLLSQQDMLLAKLGNAAGAHNAYHYAIEDVNAFYRANPGLLRYYHNLLRLNDTLFNNPLAGFVRDKLANTVFGRFTEGLARRFGTQIAKQFGTEVVKKLGIEVSKGLLKSLIAKGGMSALLASLGSVAPGVGTVLGFVLGLVLDLGLSLVKKFGKVFGKIAESLGINPATLRKAMLGIPAAFLGGLAALGGVLTAFVGALLGGISLAFVAPVVVAVFGGLVGIGLLYQGMLAGVVNQATYQGLGDSALYEELGTKQSYDCTTFAIDPNSPGAEAAAFACSVMDALTKCKTSTGNQALTKATASQYEACLLANQPVNQTGEEWAETVGILVGSARAYDHLQCVGLKKAIEPGLRNTYGNAKDYANPPAGFATVDDLSQVQAGHNIVYPPRQKNCNCETNSACCGHIAYVFSVTETEIGEKEYLVMEGGNGTFRTREASSAELAKTTIICNAAAGECP